MQTHIGLSVVIPVFNEGPNVVPLMTELHDALRAYDGLWEVIWIDDASTDDTLNELRQLRATTPTARVLHLKRHAGQSAALWVGLHAANGNVLVTLDGDRQNCPDDIPQMLAHLADFDFIVGYRRLRKDNVAKRLFSWCANAVRNWLTSSQIPDSGCALRAFRRKVLAVCLPFNGMHRYLPTLAELNGFRVQSIAVQHAARRNGRSKYGILDRIVAPLCDCLILKWWATRHVGAMCWEEIDADAARMGQVAHVAQRDDKTCESLACCRITRTEQPALAMAKSSRPHSYT